MRTDYSFAELQRWIDALPDQHLGVAGALSDVVEPYVEIMEGALARPGDVVVIESIVADFMQRRLKTYLNQRSGRIYWRVPFEWKIAPYPIVVRYDEDGPDIDFVTNQRCIKDKNWIGIKAYCRLVRARVTVTV